MRLYHYWRSSCSWRVRWALEHKGISFSTTSVGLLNGESESDAHLVRNPAGFVPVLELADGSRLTESMAICEYLEETKPTPALLPKSALDRAYVRMLCEVINSGTQPLQNLNVQDRVSENADERKAWSAHWIAQGLAVYEQMMSRGGTFSLGDTVTLADMFLVPQIYNAHRYDVSFAKMPRIAAIYERSLKLPACAKSHPDHFVPAA